MNKAFEEIRVGKIIGEILENRFEVDIKFSIVETPESGPLFVGTIHQNPINAESPACWAHDQTAAGYPLSSVLENLLGMILQSKGKPSLRDRDIAAMKLDEETADVLVETGPGACCVQCGSKKPLRLEELIPRDMSWKNGLVGELDYEFAKVRHARPGEIGTCPDCGKCYTLAVPHSPT